MPRAAAFAAATLGLFVLMALPTGADHPQTMTNSSGTYTVQFDHDGDNEWWVEVQVRGLNGDGVNGVEALVEGETTWHFLQGQSNDWERQQAGWGKYASSRPHDPVHVPPGKLVKFRATVHDAVTGHQDQVTSCWFTHPAGVEQCSSSNPSTFDAGFTGFRGNEWWVQANVATNGPAIAKVDVRIGSSDTWMPLSKQSWGPTAWGGSHHFPQGSVLQMRATATDGRVDLSSCRQWVPPANQDAQIVPCSNVGFEATFSGVKGNEWWVQAQVAGNMPVSMVEVRTGCEPHKTAWRPLENKGWGWAASYHLPPGTKVEFRATSTQGFQDQSGMYLWTAATPAPSC